MRPIWILLLGVLFCFHSVVELGFVSDDHGLISNPSTGIANQSIASVFGQDLWHFQESQSGYYRPIMMLSLLLDHRLFGLWPGGYHIHSLLWHTAAVWLLFVIFRRPFGDHRALFMSGLFAFHPLVVEQVCFIAARNDSMALAFGLGAVSLTMPSTASTRRCLVASVLATAACLSKETGALVLCLLPLMDWARHKTFAGWHRYGALAAGVTAWLYIREMLGPGLLHSPPMNGSDLMQTEKISIIGTLLGKLLWPFPLTDSLHIAYLDAPPMLAVALCVTVMGFLLVSGSRWAKIGVLFSLAALLPAMLAIASRFLIGDRYLTLSLLGLCLALTSILPKDIPKAIVFVMVLPLAWFSQARVADWDSDLSLAQSAHDASPTPYTASWLGHENFRANRVQAALAFFDEATAAQPPTCDFAGEWIRAARTQGGGAAGAEVGQTVWTRKCAAAPGVRGEWAHSLLAAGDVQMAKQILSPRPSQCDQSLVIPLLVIDTLDGTPEASSTCLDSADVSMEDVAKEVDRLVMISRQQLPQTTVPESNGAPPTQEAP